MGPWFAKVQPQLVGRAVDRLRPDGHHQRHPVQAVRASSASSRRWTTRKLPNYAANAGPTYKNRAVRPGQRLQHAVGVRASPASPTTRRRSAATITKLADLWDPAFKGKVGMFSDTQELGNFGLLAARHRPGEVDAGRLEEGRRQAQGAEGRRHRPQVLRPELHRRARQGRGLDHPGLVRRHLPEERLRRHGLQVRDPGGGRHDLDRQHARSRSPRPNPVDAIKLMDFFYEVDDRRPRSPSTSTTSCPVPAAQAQIASGRGQARPARTRTSWRRSPTSPLVFPTRGRLREAALLPRLQDRRPSSRSTRASSSRSCWR